MYQENLLCEMVIIWPGRRVFYHIALGVSISFAKFYNYQGTSMYLNNIRGDNHYV